MAGSSLTLLEKKHLMAFVADVTALAQAIAEEVGTSNTLFDIRDELITDGTNLTLVLQGKEPVW